jgi:hypothetical protein
MRDNGVQRWEYEVLEAKCERLEVENERLKRDIAKEISAENQVPIEFNDNFINELYRLMKVHGICKITPLNMDAYMDVNKDIFIQHFRLDANNTKGSELNE